MNRLTVYKYSVLFISLVLVVLVFAPSAEAASLDFRFGFFQCSRHGTNAVCHRPDWLPLPNYYQADAWFEWYGHGHGGSSRIDAAGCLISTSGGGSCVTYSCKSNICGNSSRHQFFWFGRQKVSVSSGEARYKVTRYARLRNAEIRINASGTGYYNVSCNSTPTIKTCNGNWVFQHYVGCPGGNVQNCSNSGQICDPGNGTNAFCKDPATPPPPPPTPTPTPPPPPPPPTPTPTPTPVPTTSNVSVTLPDYCTSGPTVTTNWEFTDPSGSPQSAYQIQVDDQGSFSSPEVDSGKVVCTNCRAYFSGIGHLQFNTTYQARVRTWNTYNEPSSWQKAIVCAGDGCQPNASWKAPSYAYPNVNSPYGFTWSPLNPPIATEVQFTDNTLFDPSSNNKAWSWTFVPAGGGSGSSTEQNPTYAFNSDNIYQVTENVRDNAMPPGEFCSLTQAVNIQKPIPIWIEIAPR